MALFEGLPTFAGGFNAETNITSIEVYQYHWKTDEWKLREDLALPNPRTEGVMFEVPRYMFGIC